MNNTETVIKDLGNDLYDKLPPTIFPNTWLKYSKPYLSELGYFDNYLPLEYYVRNFKILGENIKKMERICSFDYFPNYYVGLGERNWEMAEKIKKLLICLRLTTLKR